MSRGIFFNIRSIEYICRLNYIRHNWNIFSKRIEWSHPIDQRREQKGEKEREQRKTDKNIVKKKERERKYKTKHIHTSWYAPLDSFIFLRLCTFELLQSI